MKKVSKGFILLVTLIFIQVISLLVISNQRLLIQAEKSYASYQKAIRSEFNRFHAARMVSARSVSGLSSCVFDVGLFDEIAPATLDAGHWCQINFDSMLYLFFIEHLSARRCMKPKDKFFAVDYYQLVIKKDKQQLALHHIYYKKHHVAACDDKLAFVIKSHLPASWFIR